MSIEHFKKRLIQKHQKPLLEPSPNAANAEVDEETASNSSGSSVVSNGQKQEKKKEGGTVQTRVARKRNVCRSKFRHDSLKIFKLGTSAPTSLCKSKEPYNVSTEKNLQLCCESKETLPQINNNNNDTVNNNSVANKVKPLDTNKLVSKEPTIEQIMYYKDSNQINGKDLQRSLSLDSYSSSRRPGKHILPAIVPEIPFKKQNMGSRGHLDEGQQNIYQIRAQKDEAVPIYSNQTTAERISPDSTSAVEAATSPVNPPPVMTNISMYIPKDISQTASLPPPNPTINPIMEKTQTIPSLPAGYFYNFPDFSKASDPQRYVDSILTKLNKNYPQPVYKSSENPINLSVKENNLLKILDPYFYGKYEHILDSITREIDELKVDSLGTSLNQINKDLTPYPFPQIYDQINRLNNSNSAMSEYHKQIKMNVAKSMLPMSRLLMTYPFNAEILAIFNYFYQYLMLVKVTLDVSEDVKLYINDLIDEIISFLTKMLFNDSGINPTLRRYTKKILTNDLDSQIPLINDVLRIIPEKYFDPTWMRHLLNALKRGGSKQNGTIHLAKRIMYTNSYQPPVNNKKSEKNSSKLSSVDMAVANRYVLTQNTPTQVHWPRYSNNPPTVNKSDSVESVFNKTAVIVQDKSMVVTIADKDSQKTKDNIKKVNRLDVVVEKVPATCDMEIKKEQIRLEENNVSFSDDLNLFKELVRNEDREVYHKVLKKLVVLKQTNNHPEVITIKDVKDSSKKASKQNVEKVNVKTVQDLLQKNASARPLSNLVIIDRDNNSIQKSTLHSNKRSIKPARNTPQEKPSIVADPSFFNNKSTSSSRKDANFQTNTNGVEEISGKSSLLVLQNGKIPNYIKNSKSKPKMNKLESRIPISQGPIEVPKTKRLEKHEKEPNNKPVLPTTPIIEDISSEEDDRKPFTKTIGYDHKISNRERFFNTPNLNVCHLISNNEPEPIPRFIYTMPVGPLVPLKSDEKKNFVELTNFKETKQSLSCKLKINNEPSYRCNSIVYPENASPKNVQSPVDLVSPHSEILGKSGANWKNWITEERNKSFLEQQRLSDRRQSIETISSVGSDYSPNVDHEENYVKIRLDKKWYKVNKSVMESIPKGKMTYDREKNHLIRYFDDTQIEQFIKNVNVNLVAASDFFKQMKERVGGYLCDNIFLTPFEVPEKNEVIQLSRDISFAEDDNISDPELYVQEVEKVQRFVPKDFFGFYKYVTGYQIIHNHDPISFQMFLTMHNTNRIKSFYKRYLTSILDNKHV